ncbi:hypothetical protein Pelo_15035 [Pelomyxa schiedti]|nr:hypothetical protein Pelo_15035 [Pelomyxa schiedti]
MNEQREEKCRLSKEIAAAQLKMDLKCSGEELANNKCTLATLNAELEKVSKFLESLERKRTRLEKKNDILLQCMKENVKVHADGCCQEPLSFLIAENPASESLNAYRAIGKLICATEPILPTLHKALEHAHNATEYNPFILLCGSSGVGKTQLGFTLAYSIPTIYVPICALSDSNQAIYNTFAPFSNSLLECAKRDLADIKNIEGWGLNVASLREKTLWTYAWVHWVIQNKDRQWPWYAADGGFTITLERKVHCSVVSRLIKALKPCSLCFFLDEVTLDPENDLHLFLRNAFRACWTSPILCGSDLNAANACKSTASGSLTWCLLINRTSVSLHPQTPRIVAVELLLPNLADGDQSCSNLLNYLLKNSRPRFALWVADFLEEQNTTVGSRTDFAQLLNSMCTKIATEVLKTKATIRATDDGRMATLALMSPIVYNKKEGAPLESPLVSHHFAHLTLAEGTIHCLELWFPHTLRLNGDDFEPLVQSHFPNPETEVILHMCLSGTLGTWPLFDKHEKPTTARVAFYECLQRSSRSLLKVNTNAVHNDGDYLEQLCCIAACVGSHVEGFLKNGMPLSTFFGFFLRHLLSPPQSSNAPDSSDESSYCSQSESEDSDIADSSCEEEVEVEPQPLESADSPVPERRESSDEEASPSPSDSSYNAEYATESSAPAPTLPFSAVRLTKKLEDFCPALLHLCVGFLSPPNQRWPKVLTSVGDHIKLGSIDREKNATGTDIFIDGGLISIEAKNHKAALKSSVLKDVIDRIQMKTLITILVCQKLQSVYFKKKKGKTKFARKPGPTENLSIIGAKIAKDRNTVQLFPIPGVPQLAPAKTQRLLCVVPIGNPCPTPKFPNQHHPSPTPSKKPRHHTS